jgi:hypothetical protein
MFVLTSILSQTAEVSTLWSLSLNQLLFSIISCEQDFRTKSDLDAQQAISFTIDHKLLEWLKVDIAHFGTCNYITEINLITVCSLVENSAQLFNYKRRDERSNGSYQFNFVS